VDYSPALRLGSLLSTNGVRIVELKIGSSGIDDAAARELARLRELLTLELVDCKVAPEEAPHLATLESLTSVNLTGTANAGDILASLTCEESLRNLTLTNTRLEARSIEDICRFRNLASLDLRRSGIDEQGAARIRAALPNVRLT
jgi:hypothetical protein